MVMVVGDGVTDLAPEALGVSALALGDGDPHATTASNRTARCRLPMLEKRITSGEVTPRSSGEAVNEVVKRSWSSAAW